MWYAVVWYTAVVYTLLFFIKCSVRLEQIMGYIPIIDIITYTCTYSWILAIHGAIFREEIFFSERVSTLKLSVTSRLR